MFFWLLAVRIVFVFWGAGCALCHEQDQPCCAATLQCFLDCECKHIHMSLYVSRWQNVVHSKYQKMF